MEPKPASKTVRRCVGRFCLDVPEVLEPGPGSFRLQHVSLEELRWARPDAPEREHAWPTRLASIEALSAERSLPTDPRGRIREQRALSQVGARAVLFHRHKIEGIATWGALLQRGPVDVWLQIDGDLDRAEDWARRVTELAAAYRPLEAAEPRPAPGEDWFYLRQGVVALPVKSMEQAEVSFGSRVLQLELKVTTRTVSKVESSSLMERFASAMAAVAGALSADHDVVPQRSRPRVVAGLRGEELVLRTVEGGRRRLACLWRYRGEPKSGSHPEVVLELEAPLEQEEATLALWSQLLDSMRPAAQ